MAYFLEVQRAVVHASDSCPEIAGRKVMPLRLPDAIGLTAASKEASAVINTAGSKPPISINAYCMCN